MKARVKPTGDAERLRENLEKKVEKADIQDGEIEVELDDTDVLERTPGIESFTVDGETFEGLKGRPVQEEAYVRIESEEDAVKALLATIQGYDLRVLNTGRQWDLRQLKQYNPDIKHLKFDEPKEVLQIDKAVNVEGKEDVDIDVPEEEAETIYREMLT